MLQITENRRLPVGGQPAEEIFPTAFSASHRSCICAMIFSDAPKIEIEIKIEMKKAYTGCAKMNYAFLAVHGKTNTDPISKIHDFNLCRKPE